MDQRARFVGSGVEKEKLTAGTKQFRLMALKHPAGFPREQPPMHFRASRKAWIPAG